MRDDQRFEIERAFDLLPHVVGASWAAIWFRMSGRRRPTRDEFRAKAAEYLGMLGPICDAYRGDEGFEEISGYIRSRMDEEIRRIRDGENGEVERRYDRYADYG